MEKIAKRFFPFFAICAPFVRREALHKWRYRTYIKIICK